MSKFKEGLLTTNGKMLANEANNGQIQLTFTRAIMSADDHSNDSDDTIRQLTSLTPFNQINIGYGQPIGNDKMRYALVFANTNLKVDSYVRTVGVYASDGTNEYLYSVLVSTAPDLEPAYNGVTPESYKINFSIYVGDNANVQVTVAPIDNVTVEQLNASYSAANSNAQSFAASLGASESADIVVVKSQIGSNADRIYNLEQRESGDASAAKSQTGSNATRIYNLEQLEASDVTSLNSNVSVAHSETGSNAARIYNLEQKESGDASAAKSQTGSNATRIYNLEQKESGDASAAKSQTGSNATRIYNLEQLEAGDIATVKSETGSNAARIYNLEQKEDGDASVAKSQTASNASRIYDLEQKQSGDTSVVKQQTGSNATRIYNLEQKENLDINNLNNAIATINNYNNAIKLSISQTLLYHWDVRTVQMANVNPNKTLVFYYFPDSNTLRFQGGIQAQAGDTIQLVSYGIYGAGNYMALNGYTNVDVDSSFFDYKPISLIGTSANAPWYSINVKVYQDGWIDFSNSWIRLKFS